MALVAVAAFTLSFQTLTELATLAGYGSLSWLYPVTIDLGTVSSCAAWMATRSREALHMTWCLLSASILLNGCEHWLSAAGQRPEWWLVTVIAMAPPAILGVVTHLAVGLGTHSPSTPDLLSTQASELAVVSERPGPEPNGGKAGAGSPALWDESTGCPDANSAAAVTGVNKRGDPVADLLAQSVAGVGSTDGSSEGCAAPAHPDIRGTDISSDDVGSPDPLADLAAQGAGRRRIARELNITEHEARKLLASRNGHGDVPT
jgi:hypothetical protein